MEIDGDAQSSTGNRMLCHDRDCGAQIWTLQDSKLNKELDDGFVIVFRSLRIMGRLQYMSSFYLPLDNNKPSFWISFR